MTIGGNGRTLSAGVVILILLAIACSEYNPRTNVESGVAVPAIEVSPGEIAFGGVRLGRTDTRTVTLHSVGTEALRVRSIKLPDGAFAVEDPGQLDLLPDETFALEVVYAPVSVEDEGMITILSDDAAHPESYVLLSGHALVPQLAVEPNPIQFPATPEGCAPELPVTLRNVGSAPLEVDEVLLVGDTAFDWRGQALPVTIPPGETERIKISFEPGLTEDQLGAELWVGSNDPAGSRPVPISGEGEGNGPVVQRFVQPAQADPAPIDLLFTIDRSCSMENDASTLANNFTAFATSDMGDEVQVMVVTRDNGCHNGDIMTTQTPNLAAAFTTAVFGPGNPYGNTEAGLTLALNAYDNAGPGGCNHGFLRKDAKRHVVMVTDEPEQSVRDWSYYVDALRDHDPEIKLHGIVGKYGCGKGANGYLEAIEETGGLTLSLCTQDWGEQMQTLVDGLQLTGGPRRSFRLDWVPDVNSIVVTVDSVVVTTWSYDPITNEVVFSASEVPGPGAQIAISYDVPFC